MNDFNGKKYKVIKNFISAEKAKDLGEKFINFCLENNIKGDPQVVDSSAYYNYLPFVGLLSNKCKKVSKIIGETVLPAYSYARVYKNNSLLEEHIDRESCEVSITVHLDGDCEWPIYMKNSGRKEYINLNPGYAVIYYGKEVFHGRDKFLGNKYAQCFLHYVKLNGKYKEYYFDKLNFNKKENANENCLENYIAVFDNSFSDELCDEIIKEYSEEEYNECKTSIDISYYRTCKEVEISTDRVIEKNYKVRKKIDDTIFNILSDHINKYVDKFKYASAIDGDSGYQLLRYNTGEFYKEHTDSGADMRRTLSCSIILNDGYEGGDLLFFDGEYKVNCKKGSLIIFPSSFLYPHQITTVTEGVRYSIVTWIK